MAKKRDRISFVESENTKGVVEKLHNLAKSKGIKLNQFLSTHFLKITEKVK